MKCYGYILSDHSERIYYSGDAAEVPEAVRAEFLKGDLSCLYQDTSTHPSDSHCFYEKLEQWFPEETRRKIYCMHLDSPCEQLLRSKGFNIVDV